MRHRPRTLLEDELAGWPNSLYRGHELLTPFDSPLSVLELDGGYRMPHGGGATNGALLRLKQLLDG